MRAIDKIEVRTLNGGLRTTFFQVGRDIILIDNKLVTDNFLSFPVQNATILLSRIVFEQFQFIMRKANSGMIFAFEIEKNMTLSFDPCGIRTLHRIPGVNNDLLFIDVNDEHSIRISDQFDESRFIKIKNKVVEIS